MFHSIEEAVSDLQAGKPIIVVDDKNRENEGDFIALSEKATSEIINFMITHGKGLVCTTVEEDVAEKLNLTMMVEDNTDPFETAFTVSIDYKHTSTGISAGERSATIQALTNSDTVASDFKRPGHVFPLIGENGGVLKRPGHTEASLDLAKLSGAFPSAVICEIIKDDGTMARVPELKELADKYSLKMITIEDLIIYRKKEETHISREIKTVLPTDYGTFTVYGYSNNLDQKEHIALVKGDVTKEEPILVRVHSECLTGDVFRSHRCDCGPQLHEALRKIENKGCGVLIYMRQEGRGIGLLNKLKSYALQDDGLDTVEANEELGFEADLREYVLSAQILKDLCIKEVHLLTNNPNKVAGLTCENIQVSKRIPIQTKLNKDSIKYMQTKVDKLGHILNLIEEK